MTSGLCSTIPCVRRDTMLFISVILFAVTLQAFGKATNELHGCIISDVCGNVIGPLKVSVGIGLNVVVGIISMFVYLMADYHGLTSDNLQINVYVCPKFLV